MPTQREKILNKIREILESRPNGIRYSELHSEVKNALPEINVNTIHGNLWYLKQKIDNGEIKEIVRPEKGLYVLEKYLEGSQCEVVSKRGIETTNVVILEKSFYKPFAEYLVNDLEECTKAVPLGGNRFQGRWGTPDVIGTYRILGPIQSPVEVVSAEIKTDANQLITSFGQACSYKLFSHKVYLVIPKDARNIDIKRIESLCLKFGLGLILFNRNNKDNPEFEILTRAVKSEPDYFYLNKYLKLIEDVASELF